MSLRITILDDGILEQDEDFFIMLTTMDSRTLVINNNIFVIIRNDDGTYRLCVCVCVYVCLCGVCMRERDT